MNAQSVRAAIASDTLEIPGCPGLWWVEVPSAPPLEDDRTAMMLGLVPDKRAPEERLLDAIDSNGESLKYRYGE